MKIKNECPFCGSDHLGKKNCKSEVKIDEYQTMGIVDSFYHCIDCNEEWGAQTNENDSVNKQLSRNSVKAVMNVIFNNLKVKNVNITELERKLGFAPRSIHKWKHELPSHSSLLLMKFIDHCDWLPNVAEAGFNKERTREIIAVALGNELVEKYAPFNECSWFSKSNDEYKYHVFTYSEKNQEEDVSESPILTGGEVPTIILSKTGTNN